jgi:hypothetical protein
MIKVIITIQLFILLTIFSKLTNCENETWKVFLETGRRSFSGSSANIFMQLIGDLKESEIIFINPNGRRDIGSIIKYPFTFNNDIGSLRQLVIGLQRNQLFYSDWFLYRVCRFST